MFAKANDLSECGLGVCDAAASYADGVVAWDRSGEVSRQSLSKPVWVRVGNKAGKWSVWVKLTA